MGLSRSLISMPTSSDQPERKDCRKGDGHLHNSTRSLARSRAPHPTFAPNRCQASPALHHYARTRNTAVCYLLSLASELQISDTQQHGKFRATRTSVLHPRTNTNTRRPSRGSTPSQQRRRRSYASSGWAHLEPKTPRLSSVRFSHVPSCYAPSSSIPRARLMPAPFRRDR